jgi:hypothetical protein
MNSPSLGEQIIAAPSESRTSNIRSLLEAKVDPTWYEMRLMCDQDDVELVKLFLSFPHVCELITESLCGYVFRNNDISHCDEIYELLEEVCYALDNPK